MLWEAFFLEALTYMDGLDSTRFTHPKILFVFTFSVTLPNQAFRKKYSYRPKCHNSISMHIMQCNEAINLKPPVNSTSSLNYQPVPSVNGSKNDSNYLMQRPTCTEFSFESHQGSLINWRQKFCLEQIKAINQRKSKKK